MHSARSVEPRSMERTAAVALLGQRGIDRREVAATILERDDPAAVVEILRRHLFDTKGLFHESSMAALLKQTEEQMAAWEAAGIGIHAWFEADYPQQLRDIREMPLVVFTRGTLVEQDVGVAVVGTRQVSDKGMRRTRTITRMLAQDGITVVSGLAEGVDTVAHRTALEFDSRTVAVIANGVDRCYPQANTDVQAAIVGNGLVLSEYRPHTRPAKWRFLERNAIMSGYAAATIVVEAGERSGTRTQMRRALEHGRPVILLDTVLSASWAKDAVPRQNLFVASSPADVREIVAYLLAARTGTVDLPHPSPTFV